MSETYKELLVKKQRTAGGSIIRIILIVIAVFFLFFGIMGSIPLLIIGVVLGIAAYFVYLNTDLEYEYLYLDKELTIDKVMARTKRKRVASYAIERMEIMAPSSSHRLDSYNNGNRKWKIEDYSSGCKSNMAQTYTMFFEGTTKVIMEPTPEFVKAIANNAPRKVFTD